MSLPQFSKIFKIFERGKEVSRTSTRSFPTLCIKKKAGGVGRAKKCLPKT